MGTHTIGSPPMTNLEIMVFRNKLKEILQKHITFIFTQLVNSFGESPVNKHSLPTTNGVCSNNGMNSSQIISNWRTIFRRTTILGERESQSLGHFKELSSLVSCCQSFEEGTESRCQSIVCFVSVCPDSIASSNWFGVNFQDGIVRWDFLESDVGVPTIGCELRTIVLVLIVLVTAELAEITNMGKYNWEVSITEISSPFSEV